MTVHNFNWFLHAMLFYHCNFMLSKKAEKNNKIHKKKKRKISNSDSDEDISDTESINNENINSDMDCT